MKCHPCAAKAFVPRATDHVSLQPLRAALAGVSPAGRLLLSQQGNKFDRRKAPLPALLKAQVQR